jgi:hypothetical protein
MEQENPLQMKDQGTDSGDEPVEPAFTDFKQPYSTGPEAPTSTHKNPPQPRNPEPSPEEQAAAHATDDEDDDTETTDDGETTAG